jgi:trehalose-6-phosphate synthase
VLPIPPLAQGKLGERRAREIKATEDPRRLYGKLMHVLAIAIPPNAEVLDDFLKETKTLLAERKIPEVTAKLMLEILTKRLDDVKRLELKLEELKRLLEEVDEG